MVTRLVDMIDAWDWREDLVIRFIVCISYRTRDYRIPLEHLSEWKRGIFIALPCGKRIALVDAIHQRTQRLS